MGFLLLGGDEKEIWDCLWTYQRICLLWSGVSSTVHSWCLQWQVPVYEVMLVLLVVGVAPVELFASVAGSGW